MMLRPIDHLKMRILWITTITIERVATILLRVTYAHRMTEEKKISCSFKIVEDVFRNAAALKTNMALYGFGFYVPAFYETTRLSHEEQSPVSKANCTITHF